MPLFLHFPEFLPKGSISPHGGDDIHRPFPHLSPDDSGGDHQVIHLLFLYQPPKLAVRYILDMSHKKVVLEQKQSEKYQQKIPYGKLGFLFHYQYLFPWNLFLLAILDNHGPNGRYDRYPTPASEKKSALFSPLMNFHPPIDSLSHGRIEEIIATVMDGSPGPGCPRGYLVSPDALASPGPKDRP